MSRCVLYRKHRFLCESSQLHKKLPNSSEFFLFFYAFFYRIRIFIVSISTIVSPLVKFIFILSSLCHLLPLISISILIFYLLKSLTYILKFLNFLYILLFYYIMKTLLETRSPFVLRANNLLFTNISILFSRSTFA